MPVGYFDKGLLIVARGGREEFADECNNFRDVLLEGIDDRVRPSIKGVGSLSDGLNDIIKMDHRTGRFPQYRLLVIIVMEVVSSRYIVG